MPDQIEATVSRGVVKENTKKSIDIKGNMYTLMSVVLRVNDLQQINHDLTERVAQAPEFFKNTPVIIDFANITIDASFDFKTLFKTVRQQQLLPVAVRGIEKALREQFQNIGVPIVELAASGSADNNTEEKERLERLRTQSKSVVVDKPVRSGQQCSAESGDLIVLSQCNADAELIADGNIHVYGTLRGRALCGVHGDTNARIYCTALEAQLVSVAGHYKVLEEIPAAVKNRPVQIRLKNDQLYIEPL